MSDVTEIELPDGSVRKLGNNPPPSNRLMRVWMPYGETENAPLIDESKWSDLITKINAESGGEGPQYPFLPYVHDQDGVGQCNCDDTAALIESCRLSAGLPLVHLSAGDLYDRINGGRDQGSTLEDALHVACTEGIGTVTTCGTNIWHRGWKSAPTDERMKYRVLEAFLCPTFKHCMSAVLSGFRLSTGIAWYDNYTPGSDGWIPSPRGNSGGHAIMGYKPAMKNGKYGIWHQNSWGTSFGVGGRMILSQDCYTNAIGGWWAVRAVVDEGGVVPIAA